MANVKETLKTMQGKVNAKGEVVPNRFSKKNFTTLMKAMANDPDFKVKVPVVKEGEIDHLEEIMVSEDFRKCVKKMLEKAGVDKNESAMVLDPSFTFDNMDGMYEFFSTVVYEYMAAGNKFDFIPREDFKGSITVKNVKESTKVSDARNPKTGENLGTFEYKTGKHKSLVASSPCPDYLKGRKKIK